MRLKCSSISISIHSLGTRSLNHLLLFIGLSNRIINIQNLAETKEDTKTANAPACHADPMNFPPQWQSTQFYADKEATQELLGKITRGRKIYVVLTYMDTDKISEVKFDTKGAFKPLDSEEKNSIYRYISPEIDVGTAESTKLRAVATDASADNLKAEKLIEIETTA